MSLEKSYYGSAEDIIITCAALKERQQSYIESYRGI